jgi:hypothetical protein
VVFTDAPNVTAVVPETCGAVESAKIGIVGFGLGSSQADVAAASLAGVPCLTVQWVNASYLVCTAGKSAGGAAAGPVVVTTASGGPSPQQAGFAYTAPSIASIQPATLVLPVSGSFAGTVITIQGASLGRHAADLAHVNVTATGGPGAGTAIPCAARVWVSNTMVTCTLPTSGVNVGAAIVALASRSGGSAASTPAMLTIIAPDVRVPNVTSITPSAGPVTGGTFVTIGGAGFGLTSLAVTAVTIANVPCVGVLWNSDTQITCVTTARPAGPTTGPVVVTSITTGDSSTTATAPLFTYVPSSTVAIPRIDSFSPEAAPITGGTVVTIRGTNLGTSAADVLAVTTASAACTKFTYTSAQQLECTVASVPVPLDGPLTVTTGTGGATVATRRFTYYDPAVIAPTVTAAEPPRGSLEGGYPVTLHGITFGDNPSHVSSVAFGTTQSVRTTYVSSGVIECVAPAHPAGIVPVSVVPADASKPSTPGEFWYLGRPTISAVAPTVLTLAEGGVITIHGIHWDEEVEVTVESHVLGLHNVSRTGQPVLGSSNSTTTTTTTTTTREMAGSGLPSISIEEPIPRLSNLQGAVARPADPSRPGAIAVRILKSHLKNEGGYHTLAVRNPATGGTIASGEYLFATDDCPEPGQFGTGKTCKDCPKGGVCPGGNRIWPRDGFWNPGEDAGYVVACDPPGACLGGKDVTCSNGYEGDVCGKCSDDFYRGNGACNACPASTSVILFIVGDCVVWLSFALAAVLIQDRGILSYCVMVVRSLQMLAGLGTSAEGQDMPGWVLTIYEVLHLFSGDYSFIKPDCVSPVPFEQMFGVSIAYSIGVFVPVWIGLAIAGPGRFRSRAAN